MTNIKNVFGSFSVNNLGASMKFYKEVLGLDVTDTGGMGLSLTLPAGGRIHIYEKGNHQPAGFTVLNLEVANIDEAVDELTAKGIVFERYEGFPQDEKGIARGEKGRGPSIAWFKDPAGNILSVLQPVE